MRASPLLGAKGSSRNQGLVVAEIELKEASEVFIRPDWLGEEVTGDVRYYNSMLSRHPYSTWKKKK